MTDTKRMPKPMSSKKLAQYRELRAELIVQSELIMSIFNPLNDREYVTGVEFEMGHPLGPQVEIHYTGYAYGEDYNEFFACPESYFNMTADELRAEKTRIVEEEKRKKAEKAAKAKAAWEKRKAEKAKKEAEKKDNEKNERYQKYLELKKEFEGTTESPDKRPVETSTIRGIGGAPVEEAVYFCKYWEHDDNDPSGCGETWQWCNNAKSGRRECGCKRTYAMQFCPFYKKGKLAGKWVINDDDKDAAEKFKREFVGKEE